MRNLRNILYAPMNMNNVEDRESDDEVAYPRFVEPKPACPTRILFFQLAPRVDSVPQTARTKRVCGLSRLNTRRLSVRRYAHGVFIGVSDDASFRPDIGGTWSRPKAVAFAAVNPFVVKKRIHSERKILTIMTRAD